MQGQASELLKLLELRGVARPNSFLDRYVQLKDKTDAK